MIRIMQKSSITSGECRCNRPLLVTELQFHQSGIDPIECEQFSMSAFLAKVAMMHDEDAIGLSHRAEAVSDDHRCTPLDQSIDRFLDQCFRLGIDMTGRLVENQDLRISRQCPCKGDQLPLAAR